MRSFTRISLWCLCAVVGVPLICAQGFKPGQCPTGFQTYNSSDENCPNATCTIDQDCGGERICCTNGCSRQCVDPIVGLQSKLSVLSCEGSSAALSCRNGQTIRIDSAFWGRGDSNTCAGNEDPSDGVTCSLRQVFDLLVGLCEGRGSCYVPASVGIFGEPCANATTKYLKADYHCEEITYRGLMCESSGKLPVSCPDNKLIIAESAFFGRDDLNTTCPHNSAVGESFCSMDTATDIFKQTCDGRNRCELDAHVDHFGDPCPGNQKYLRFSYKCTECVNNYGDDAMCELWSLLGDCESNSAWMMQNCRKACWKCDKTPPACTNIHANNTECEQWAAAGFCTSNPSWMHVFCRRSCTQCAPKTDCSLNKWDEDSNRKDCQQWFARQECSLNTQYMFQDCTKSCFGCNIDNTIRCANKYFNNTQCETWALEGECQRNPGFMIPNCFKACVGCSNDPVCENVYPDAQCDAWALLKECQANPVFMYMNCWRSCMRCDSSVVCENKNPSDAECEIWAKTGECNNNPSFMYQNCSKSCTKCGPVPQDVADCIDVEGASSDCSEWADAQQCHLNPNWMIPNCRRSCSMCDRPALKLNKVGADPVPGGLSSLTKHNTFILPASFTQRAYLTHFIAFFGSTEPVYIQIWAKASDGSYYESYSKKVTPVAANSVQTVLADPCMMVVPEDRLGFTTLGGNSSPITQTHIDDILEIKFRRATATNQFINMLYPYEFALSAGYTFNEGNCGPLS